MKILLILAVIVLAIWKASTYKSKDTLSSYDRDWYDKMNG